MNQPDDKRVRSIDDPSPLLMEHIKNSSNDILARYLVGHLSIDPRDEDYFAAVIGAIRRHAPRSAIGTIKYQRLPNYDKRISLGDDYAGDAWVRWTAVGHTPEDAQMGELEKVTVGDASSAVMGGSTSASTGLATPISPAPSSVAAPVDAPTERRTSAVNEVIDSSIGRPDSTDYWLAMRHAEELDRLRKQLSAIWASDEEYKRLRGLIEQRITDMGPKLIHRDRDCDIAQSELSDLLAAFDAGEPVRATTDSGAKP